MAKKQIKEPVLEITPSETVVPLDDVITQELIKANITDSILLELETAAAGIEISGIDDKVNYDSANKLRIAAKNTRVLTTKVCKLGREESLRIQRLWISKENELTERISKVEDSLAAKQAVIDAEKDRIKAERETKEQIILQERSVKLIQMGMQLIDGAYVMDDIKISVTSAKNYDDFSWNTLIAGVETKFKEKEVIRLEEERLKEEAAQAAKLLAEQNLAKQEELRKQQEEINAQKRALEEQQAKQKAEAERLILERENAVKKAKEDRLKSRMSSLFAIGFSQQGDSLLFKDMLIQISLLDAIQDSDWPIKLESLENTVKHMKVKIEEERLAEIERVKAEAIAAEKKRAEAEAMAKELELEKARVEIQKKEEAKIAEEKRLAALAPDIDKLNNYLKAMHSIPIPVFGTDSYVQFALEIKSIKDSCLKHIYEKRPR